MAVTREAVVWGFRLILGHDPESEAGIEAHRKLADEATLVEVLLRSREFRDSGRFSGVMALRPDLDAAAAGSWAQRTKSRLKAVLGWNGPVNNSTEAVLPWPPSTTSSLKFAAFGNCQVTSVGRLMQAMTGGVQWRSIETTPTFHTRLRSGELDISGVLAQSDLVFVQCVGEVMDIARERFPDHAHKLRQFPPVAYAGFHPDCVYVRAGEGHLSGPMGEYHSAIALWAWRKGLDVDRTVDLFRGEVFDALGYFTYAEAGYTPLLELGRSCSFPLASLLDRWRGLGCWMHTINHPKIAVLADIARLLLEREGIRVIPDVQEWLEDPLLHWPVWPVYPELAQRFGLQGSYTFKFDRGLCPTNKPVLTLDLPAFVSASFEAYRQHAGPPLECSRIDTAVYDRLSGLVRERPAPITAMQAPARAGIAVPQDTSAKGASPYEGLADTAYWRRAVARIPLGDLDPVLAPSFGITPADRVATAGSCFAQHIARTLQRQGFGYFVVDDDASLPADERERRGIGMYSARFGNIYTARQLVQLFDRAFGEFVSIEPAWQRPDGRLVDPLRPQIEPDGFETPEAMLAARQSHLAQVRQMFCELNVFVFTLGLTEAWRSRMDGTVFPLAPGVVAGNFDPARHEFVNFDVSDVEVDLRGFVARLQSINPGARVVLTVSPVPLIATYGAEHVLAATAYSKAVLRAAAGAVVRATNQVDYFPSYEIITSTHARGRYFEDDLRSVTEDGVAHVMRVFLAHYAAAELAVAAIAELSPEYAAIADEQRQLQSIVCDEEAIDRHRT